jgi:hypothetical protein
MTANSKSRDDLLRDADEARTRLMRTVVVLEQRRHKALDLPRQMGRALRRFATVGALVAMGSVAITALAVHRVMTRRHRRRQRDRARWRLAWSVFRHPEREVRVERPERRPFAVEVLRSLLLTLVTSALAVPVRRAIRGAEGR